MESNIKTVFGIAYACIASILHLEANISGNGYMQQFSPFIMVLLYIRAKNLFNGKHIITYCVHFPFLGEYFFPILLLKFVDSPFGSNPTLQSQMRTIVVLWAPSQGAVTPNVLLQLLVRSLFC